MPDAMQKKLHDFVEQVVGMNYRISISSLRRKKNEDAGSRKGFFCSELVASALQHIGVLGPEPAAGQYWPGTFANDTKHKVKLTIAIDAMSQASAQGSGAEFRLDSTERLIMWPNTDIAADGAKSKRGCLG